MPRTVNLKGPRDAKVPLNFQAPMWLKRLAVEAAAAEGKAYSAFCLNAIREAAELAVARAQARRERGGGT